MSTNRTHNAVFINVPVDDMQRSREFFEGMGYVFDENMCCDESSAAVLGEGIMMMLLRRDMFDGFHKGETAKSGTHESITCFDGQSREQVDAFVERALELGATEQWRQEMGEWGYGRSFRDLDGHIWEMMWMDMEAANQAGARN